MIGTIRNPDDCFDGQPLHIAGTRHVPIRLLPVSSTPLDMPWSQSLHALSKTIKKVPVLDLWQKLDVYNRIRSS
jgi:hypothetical protein